MMNKEHTAVIVGAARLPTGRFLGGLSPLKAPQLGAKAIEAVVDRSGVPAGEIQDVIMGNVVQAGVGQAPARQAALMGGIPETVPAVTINKVCGSGLKAAMLAAQAIKAGDNQVIVAGGMESMSNAPYLLRGYRDGVKFGDRQIVDGLVNDGLWCSFGECHMGGYAEYTAMKAEVSRIDQDEFAACSHEKAIRAIDAGEFDAEIVQVEVPGRKGSIVVDTDEPPRRETSVEALAKLRPAFGADAPPEVQELSVTAGNAPGLNDGAAAILITSEAYAEANGLDIQKLMEIEGTSVPDYGLVEMNEAFAVQALADGRQLGVDWDRVNVRGGAVALGHPIGASGARILTTLVHAMRDGSVEKGLATLCLGGGNAVAMSIELA
jgi:acetyl-CoA C-acetyltransferase